jgi:hypothetical protein
METEISAALAGLDRMAELPADHTDLQSIGDLFLRLNARLFLRFEEVQRNKRTVNRVSGGVVTFGSSPPPVDLYEGPTGRRALGGMAGPADFESAEFAQASEPCGSGREGESLGKVNRGERI